MLDRTSLVTALASYNPPQDTRANDIIENLRQRGFDPCKNTVALIGIGGTISSSYSAAKETIIPFPTMPALNIVDGVRCWGIMNDAYTAFDPFAKDSRDLVVEDIYRLLDVVLSIPNRRILVTCGTYLLPLIAEALFSVSYKNKIIAVTGSILPHGFVVSDASSNVMSALTLVNFFYQVLDEQDGKVFASFHSNTYSTLESIRAINLHPDAIKDIKMMLPQMYIPVKGG